MIEKYNMLHGEFIEFIWKTLFEYKDETEKKNFGIELYSIFLFL